MRAESRAERADVDRGTRRGDVVEEPFELDAGERRWPVLEAHRRDVGLGVRAVAQHRGPGIGCDVLGGGHLRDRRDTQWLSHAEGRYPRAERNAGVVGDGIRGR